MVALVGGIYVEYLSGREFWRKLAVSAPQLPEIANSVLGGFGLLLVALVSYGGYAYPHLPKSWGGGSPIYVEFVVEEEAIDMLETLGLRVGDGGLTERVTFLTESSERIFVVTQRHDTLSFDPSLVKASRFYNVDYYVSAEAHLSRGDGYREQRRWSKAIDEYNAALLIQADLVDARVGRGMAFTEAYLESVKGDSSDLLRDSARADLSDAITQAKEKLEAVGQGDETRTKLEAAKALAHYERGRLCFHLQEYTEAAEDLGKAIKLDLGFGRMAMHETAFEQKILYDPSFRKVYGMKDGELAEAYAALGNSLKTDQPENAAYAYDMAAKIAQSAQDLAPYRRKKRSAHFSSLRAQVLESLSRNEDACEAWKQAKEADPGNWMYRYQFALLSYRRGRLQDVRDECAIVIKREEQDLATIGCRILRGNVNRDEQDQEAAPQPREDYTWAAEKAIDYAHTSYAATAYYQYARLETREGNIDEAIRLLERAVWLDRALSEQAERESDFDVLRESASVDHYQRAIHPPIVTGIESDDVEGTISLLLQEPVVDFPERLQVLVQVFPQADLVTLDGIGLDEPSEDQLLYTFHLGEATEQGAGELAARLRELLELPE
jgi:tetratricopeptide (TPR) repeat protein